MLQTPRPIIETLKNSDKHKQFLDSILLDQLKLNEEIEEEEEEDAREVIKNYRTLKEGNDPGIFTIPIHIEGRYETQALVDTGSNINVLPHGIYMMIGGGEVKPIERKIKLMDHSRAEPMGIMRNVLCQVGVTTIIARFLVLDIPIDKDVPIFVGRSFINTLGSTINTITKTTSTFDGACHQEFQIKTTKLIPEISTDESVMKKTMTQMTYSKEMRKEYQFIKKILQKKQKVMIQWT